MIVFRKQQSSYGWNILSPTLTGICFSATVCLKKDPQYYWLEVEKGLYNILKDFFVQILWNMSGIFLPKIIKIWIFVMACVAATCGVPSQWDDQDFLGYNQRFFKDMIYNYFCIVLACVAVNVTDDGVCRHGVEVSNVQPHCARHGLTSTALQWLHWMRRFTVLDCAVIFLALFLFIAGFSGAHCHFEMLDKLNLVF